MEIIAQVKGITYHPYLCKELSGFGETRLAEALITESSFLYTNSDSQSLAISVWVSPKRTRSYPYARVYNTLAFGGRKATIIPVVKDEGRDGDCDYLQWDTVALMGLLGIYVIPAFYADAERNPAYSNKITSQRLDVAYITAQLELLKYYHSSALHWNLEQFDRLPDIGRQALECYREIGIRLGVKLKSETGLEKRIEQIKLGMEEFLKLSRVLSQAAQSREVQTIQPKEFFEGTKASVTITDLVGGAYHLTSDHCEIEEDTVIRLVESKHSNTKSMPAIDDIKEGLVKMALFSNLISAACSGKTFKPIAVLRLASNSHSRLTDSQMKLVNELKKEAKANEFELHLELPGIWIPAASRVELDITSFEVQKYRHV